MPQTIANLLAELTPDPWRACTSFSTDIAEANKRMFEAGTASDAICGVLGEWLGRYQPCLIGRIAARRNLLSYCILTEQELRQDDEVISAKIQDARTQWTADGFAGKKSGFVILAVSPAVAYAAPDQNLKALAKRLCSIYLMQEVEADRICQDDIFLEKQGDGRSTWKWLAGVNYFCANGDGRWWQDHRIPGGLAFSVNSIGHLAKSGALAQEAMNSWDPIDGVPPDSSLVTPVNSLNKALEFAMRTILMASETVSGKATELRLMPSSSISLSRERCPVRLSSFLDGKDFRSYQSYYNTDFTIPSEYFLPDISRPSHCRDWQMDLRYLFDESLDNPDYVTMGTGRRVRGASKRIERLKPTSQLIEASERLVRALSLKG